MRYVHICMYLSNKRMERSRDAHNHLKFALEPERPEVQKQPRPSQHVLGLSPAGTPFTYWCSLIYNSIYILRIGHLNSGHIPLANPGSCCKANSDSICPWHPPKLVFLNDDQVKEGAHLQAGLCVLLPAGVWLAFGWVRLDGAITVAHCEEIFASELCRTCFGPVVCKTNMSSDEHRMLYGNKVIK